MAKKKGKGIKKLLKKAGPNISKNELKQITQATGGNVAKALKRISNVGANLNSGATNMLIKQQQKSPFAFGRAGLGDSNIAQTLRQMAGTRDFRSAKMQQSGLGPGATPGTGMMIGGTVVRPSGRVAVKKRPAPAPATAPATTPVQPETPTEPVDTGDEFDYASMFGDMMSNYDSMFGDLQSQMENMFEELSSEFDTPDPIQLAALGQAYGGDLMRARQRQRRSRSDYLRNQMNNMALGGLGGGLAPMMIGGGLSR